MPPGCWPAATCFAARPRHAQHQHRHVVAGLAARGAERGVLELGQKLLGAGGGERSEQAHKGVLVTDARVVLDEAIGVQEESVIRAHLNLD